MNQYLSRIKKELYDKYGINLTKYEEEAESKEYAACQFKLNNSKIICRNAKITPTKVGQFVTFWKRKENGPIEPFHQSDSLDYFIVICKSETEFGHFIFPKSILIQKGILSSLHKEGKRAFRVYPKWDKPMSKQAIRTQNWQLDYFIEVVPNIDIPLLKNF